jgi:hypothetical protein
VPLRHELVLLRQREIVALYWSRILPLALYWDGVKYTLKDSFLALYLTDYRTGRIYLLCLVRKDDMCKCGCRGWCTLYPIILEIALDLLHGFVMGFLLACFMTKGDWPAYTEVAGVRQWSECWGDIFYVRVSPAKSNLPAIRPSVQSKKKETPIRIDSTNEDNDDDNDDDNDTPIQCIVFGLFGCFETAHIKNTPGSHEQFPCYECDICKMALSERDSLENISLDGGPWTPYTELGRLKDVKRSEIVVHVPDVATRVRLTMHLRYNNKFIGRGLIENLEIPSADGIVYLMQGDRLEPCLEMRDVSQFESMTPPFSITFWRNFADDRLLHNSPLFSIPGLGIDTHGPDTLHQWCLGPVCQFIPLALWFLVESSLYTPSIDFISSEDCTKIALVKIKATLWQHYRIKRGDSRWRQKGSEIWNLTMKMLGKRSAPLISIKAAEAKGLQEFISKLLEEYVPNLMPHEKLRGELLLASAKSAWRVELALRNSCQIELTRDQRQQLLNDYTHHVTLYHRAGGLLKPKHHMMFHMILDSSWKGAPSLYATFRDESLNGVIAGIARSCHRNRFGEVVHFKFSALQAMAAPSAMHMH